MIKLTWYQLNRQYKIDSTLKNYWKDPEKHRERMKLHARKIREAYREGYQNYMRDLHRSRLLKRMAIKLLEEMPTVGFTKARAVNEIETKLRYLARKRTTKS